ncbi:mechanosensitive ion channel [Coniochaeta sp. 2T2.1]|nr:mechanosensitive ion channel [Coniochaeta sp. 2T2.1]
MTARHVLYVCVYMADIPLRTIQSNASSTGARKRSQVPIGTTPSSEEDDTEKRGLFHHRSVAAGRRRVVKDMQRQGTDGSARLNVMGKLYNKIVGFSVITRYLVYVAPIAILLAIPLVILPITGEPTEDGRAAKDRISLGTIRNPDGTLKARGPSLFSLFVWIEVAWLSLWIGKIVAHLLPGIFMFLSGVVSSGTRKYATVLRALEIPLSLFFWGLASWLTFKYLFTDDQFEWVKTLKTILLSLFISSAVFLGEKTIVQLISIGYHQRSFDNRITESKREISLLGLLYDASRTLFPMYCPEFADEDYVINDSIEMMLTRGKRAHKRGGSVTPMRIIGDVGRFGDKITSVFGNLASEITGKNVFNPNSAHSIVVEALEKARSSEALARRIWMSFVVEGSQALALDDIIEVLGPQHAEEAEECFAAIDADGNGDISLDEMVRKVVDIGKERKAIANSMKDISQALGVFDQILMFVVLLIVIFVFLACFQSSFLTTVATAGTALLSLSFVFAVTTQEFLGSCIFLFVKHPYDVGDRVDIQGPEKQQLIVERISLLFTVFTRIDKMQVVQVPNIALNNLWIENVTRSKAMKEIIDVNVSYDTSFEDLELLRLEMEKFIRASENSRDFQPDLTITVGGVGDLDKLNLKIAIKHKSNWSNEAVRAARRSKFMCALTLALKRVPIYAPGGGGEALGGPSNPTYSVAVDDGYAAAARAKADEEKEMKRLVPTNPVRSGSTASKRGANTAEQQAAENLNTRDPVADAVDDWGYDNTLNSRDPSMERKRSHDIERVRSELKVNRETTRGRRKPGETLPPSAFGDNIPDVTLTQSSSKPSRALSFDVESGLAQPNQMQPQQSAVIGQHVYGSVSQPGNPAATGYSVYPNSSTYSPPLTSANPAVPTIQETYGLQPIAPGATAASASSSGSGSASGSRPRGASVSRTVAQAQATNTAGSQPQTQNTQNQGRPAGF